MHPNLLSLDSLSCLELCMQLSWAARLSVLNKETTYFGQNFMVFPLE